MEELVFVSGNSGKISSVKNYAQAKNIPVSFYKKILDTVHNNLEPMYKYLDIRKKKLGLDELHMYDMHINIADLPEQKFTFEEGKKIVLEALKPLGETYINDLKQAFDNRWIDKYSINLITKSTVFAGVCSSYQYKNLSLVASSIYVY